MEIRQIKNFDKELIEKIFSNIGNKIVANQRFFDNQNNVLLVSFIDDNPTGFLYAYIFEDLKSDNKKIYLYSIDVFKKYRQKGIATEFINKMKEIAKENHCKEMYLMTNKNNIAAMKLYQKTGGIKENNDDILFTYKI